MPNGQHSSFPVVAATLSQQSHAPSARASAPESQTPLYMPAMLLEIGLAGVVCTATHRATELPDGFPATTLDSALVLTGNWSPVVPKFRVRLSKVSDVGEISRGLKVVGLYAGKGSIGASRDEAIANRKNNRLITCCKVGSS